MFKIEYDTFIGGHLYTFTYDRIFLTMDAAGRAAQHIRNTKRADVYIINAITGKTIDYYWAD